MRKLLVHESELAQDLTDQIQLHSTMQMAYGLYEFNRDKLVDEICRLFKLSKIDSDPPLFTLEDSEGKTISLIMVEEYFG